MKWLPLLKKVFMYFAVEKRAIRALRKAAKLSRNDVDDNIVNLVEAAMDQDVVKVIQSARDVLGSIKQ